MWGGKGFLEEGWLQLLEELPAEREVGAPGRGAARAKAGCSEGHGAGEPFGGVEGGPCWLQDRTPHTPLGHHPQGLAQSGD